MKLAGLLRVLVLALVASLVAFPSLWSAQSASPAVAWIDAVPSGARLDSLLVGTAPPLVARSATRVPDAREMELLSALAARAPLFVALPASVAIVEAEAPINARADRAAAVAFRVRGQPGDSLLVRLSDERGALDSVSVRLDRAGHGGGAFRVRPPRPGWREWTVAAGDVRTTTGAWVDSAGPPRVLVRAGFPGWESGFVVRALEEAGAAVDLVQPLGRGLAVGDADGPAAPPPVVSGRHDVAVLLDGADVSAGERRALADFAARGGGVLVVGDQIAATPLGLGRVGAVGTIDGARIAWRLPAELSPLPADPIRSATQPISALAPGAVAGATVDGGALVTLRPLGRGRAAALGLTETWRWRMEGGRLAEHRAFWRGLVDWLASAPRNSTAVRIDRSVGSTGAAVQADVFAPGDAAAPTSLTLVRPGGARERLPLAPDPSRPGVLRAAFVPTAPGVHTLAAGDGGPPLAAFRAVADTTHISSAGPWARLALLAERSGGRAVMADSLRAEVSRRLGPESADARWPVGPGTLLALLILLAGAEWAIRRLSGRT